MNYLSDSLKSEVKRALENITNDNASGIGDICQINLNLTRWCNFLYLISGYKKYTKGQESWKEKIFQYNQRTLLSANTANCFN